jgi:hypothetical protein
MSINDDNDHHHHHHHHHWLLLLLLLLFVIASATPAHQGKCEHSKSGGTDLGKLRQHLREGTDSRVRSGNDHL